MLKNREKKETGDSFDLMVSNARYYDLIIFGLKSLFEYGLVAKPKDVIFRLIKEGVYPIIAAAPDYRVIRKVLITFSGSIESANAMKRFIQFNLWEKLSINIACFDKPKDKAELLLKSAANYCKAHNHDVSTEYIDASPVEGILKYADEIGADLIVLGNSAKNLIFSQIIGDVTMTVIRKTNRALFLSQ